MLQATFRIRRDNIQGRVSAAHPDAKLVIWCNFQTDLYEVHAAKKETATQVVEALHGEAGDLHPAPGATHTLLAACRARKTRSVTFNVEAHAGIVMPPVIAEAGWETFRIALLDEAKFESLYRELQKLGEIEILRKHKTSAPLLQAGFLVPSADLVAGLTPKQAETFLSAVNQGYYRHPRRANLKTMAKRAGRPRTTLVEHLRKAEGKLMHAVAPFVALHEPTGGPGRPKKHA